MSWDKEDELLEKKINQIYFISFITQLYEMNKYTYLSSLLEGIHFF